MLELNGIKSSLELLIVFGKRILVVLDVSRQDLLKNGLPNVSE